MSKSVLSLLLRVSVLVCALSAAHAADRRVKRLDGSIVTPAEIDSTVQQLMHEGRVTGIGIAILNDRKAVHLKAYGERDRAKHLPLTKDSVMTAASFTKSTFAYVVMQLVEEGVLELDRPVQEYLSKPLPEYPEYEELAGDDRYRRITPRMLLSHTAGFPNLRLFNMGRLNINFEPGARYAYSGEGIRLMQLVVEEVTRQPLQDLMRERVFQPFGMTRTSMVWEPAFESDYANGYDERGRSLGPQRRRRTDAAGAMQTTLGDFARFIEGVTQGRRLKKPTRAQMFSPQIRILSRTQFPSLTTETTDRNDAIRLSYGLGWGLFWTPVGKAFFKEGHDDGWQHYCVVFDDRGTGIVIMSNSSNAEGIYQELLDRLIKNTFTPIEWEGYTPYRERQPLPPLPERRAIRVDPALLDDYVGRYQAQGQRSWIVALAGASITVTEEGEAEPTVLAAASEEAFYDSSGDAEVTFERDSRGRVVALRMLRWPYRFPKVSP